ncbi:hypothetical protein NDU88_006456 [Pleurodeles waltl]|uniref:Uncharacterized protein n=1 Tax=Pleurodeles waltl TaxID=8319 RepID=A0AAV7UP18_PLEWA|nr:hypothetical protein NDU88_006456 [Pleurodeles waltl]
MNRSSRVVKLMAQHEERLKPLNQSSARRRAWEHDGNAATCRLVNKQCVITATIITLRVEQRKMTITIKNNAP